MQYFIAIKQKKNRLGKKMNKYVFSCIKDIAEKFPQNFILIENTQ